MAMITGFLIAYALITMPLIGMAVRRAYKKKETETPTLATLLNGIVETGRVSEEWFKAVRRAQDDSKEDRQAMLQATKAIAQSMIEIKNAADTLKPRPSPKGVKQFVNDLEYVRDNFVRTKGQREAVDGIINIVKRKHGTATK